MNPLPERSIITYLQPSTSVCHIRNKLIRFSRPRIALYAFEEKSTDWYWRLIIQFHYSFPALCLFKSLLSHLKLINYDSGNEARSLATLESWNAADIFFLYYLFCCNKSFDVSQRVVCSCKSCDGSTNKDAFWCCDVFSINFNAKIC